MLLPRAQCRANCGFPRKKSNVTMHKSKRAACLARELLAELGQVLLKPPVARWVVLTEQGRNQTMRTEVVQAGVEVWWQS